MAYHKKLAARGDLGRALRSIRRRMDVNQTEFSALLGWPPWLICKYELGRIEPGVSRLIQLLKWAEGAERAAIVASLAARGVSASDLTEGAGQVQAPARGAEFPSREPAATGEELAP